MRTSSLLTRTLGLNEKEAAVYLAIMELGSSTVQPIATHSGVKRTSIYYFIHHLVELGLVDVSKVRNRLTYSAKEPERMVSLQEARLKELKEALPTFQSMYHVSAQKPKISYFQGVESMKNILLEEPRCQKELLTIWSGQEVSQLFGEKFLSNLNDERREKGIHVRVIQIHKKGAAFERFKGGAKENRELRYAPPGIDFPMTLSIYDTGKVGLVTSAKEGFGLLIESHEYYQTMKVLFDMFWLQSTPAP
jgi:sugar-specific transcriptional regulator TrmB